MKDTLNKIWQLNKDLFNQLFPNKPLAIFSFILVLIGSQILLLEALYNLGESIQIIAAVFMGIGLLGLTHGYSLADFFGIGSKILLESLQAAQERAEKEPDKAKPAWDLARITLEAYFNRNLNQITAIFILSVVVMIAGFGIILYGIWKDFNDPNSITPAIIGAVAGIVTEFIGATFLFIYRSTIQQAARYTETLERINSVGMAMQILDNISTDESVTSKEKVIDAKISVAKLLLTQGQNEQPQNEGVSKTDE